MGFQASFCPKIGRKRAKSGDNKVHKGENIKVVMERNGIKTAAYVGDTAGDAAAAMIAGIDFIYARYGFGEVESSEYVIDSFVQLRELL